MSWISVDVEMDGPAPGLYSIVSIGAVVIEPTLSKTFYGKIKPISENWKPDALAISGVSREEHLTYDEPIKVMTEFAKFIETNSKGRHILVSDNPQGDGAFINYYFHAFYGSNPFGWTARRIGDLYCGMMKDSFAKWKHLRKTLHTHHPVDDAKGNAEAVLAMKEMGLKIPTK